MNSENLQQPISEQAADSGTSSHIIGNATLPAVAFSHLQVVEISFKWLLKNGGVGFAFKELKSIDSEIPEFFQSLIETVSYAPRLEMFARREREGWDVFGNEVSDSIKLNVGNNYS